MTRMADSPGTPTGPAASGSGTAGTAGAAGACDGSGAGTGAVTGTGTRDAGSPVPARTRTRAVNWTLRGGFLFLLFLVLVVLVASMIGLFATRERLILHNERVATSLSAASIDVDGTDLRVRIDPTMGPGRVSIVIRDAFEGTKLDRRVTGGTLHLVARRRDVIGDLGVSDRLEIVLPPGLDLKIRSRSGSVRLEEPDGSVDVDSGLGDVEVRGPRSPVLRIVADNGGISVREARLGTLHAQAGSGDVDARFQAPPQEVDVNAGSGSVVLRLPEDRSSSYRVHAKSWSGDTTVSVPQDSGSSRTLQVRTSTGDIDVATRG